jgi:type II secretory pathway pseudopilin PulG
LILSILKTNANSYYGTYDIGVLVQDNLTKQTQNLKLENNPVWALTKTAQNQILVGTGNGLFRIEGKKLIEIPVVKTRVKVTTLLSTKEQVYVGGDFGLAVYKNNSIQTVFSSERFHLLTVRSLTMNAGQLFIGSDNGLFTLRKDTVFRVFDFEQKVNSLKTDVQGRVWIGTEDGLFVYEKGEIKAVNLTSFSSPSIVNFINSDSKNLIVGTNDGLYYANLTNTNLNFKNIGIEEGLSNLETNINSSFVDKQNTIYFGTASGLNILNLEELTANYVLQKPHIVIKQIAINFIPVIKGQELYKAYYSDEGVVQKIILPYNKNNILIELDGVTLKSYSSLSYQYRVEGIDRKWSSKFKNPQINITNLPYGEYKIHIRGVLGDNLFSDVKTISIVINPPFYFRFWFIVLIVLIVLGILYLAFSRSIKKAKEKAVQERNEIQNKLGKLEQQSLNASMNRHFIFNALNSIQYYINKEDKLSANRYLTNFAKLIRKNLDSSTDQTSLVPLDEELDRLRLYLDLEMMRFNDKFSYEIDDEEVFTDDYFVPAMLLQPFVENSILHGILPSNKPGKIKITINDFPNHIEIRIKDNGVGIKKSLESKGLNAESHKSKGMEISSKRIDLLRQYFNENFELIGPFQTLDENGLINGTTVIIKIPK